MLIESLLTQFMKFTARRLLTFRSTQNPVLPRPQDSRSRLLYVHIPFCESLCPYCSFNRMVYEPSLAASYFEGLRRELGIYKEQGFSFDAVYVGGGTPTVMPEKLVGILDYMKSIWPIRQISVETNPNHLVPETIDCLKRAGVNRLSVGVQTFDDKLLSEIGRLGTYGSGKEIQERLASIAGVFDTLNVDLIFNLPGQEKDCIRRDIRILKDLDIDQATFYPLMFSNAKKDKFQADVGKISYRKERTLYRDIDAEMSDRYTAASAWCFSRTNGKGMIDEYIVEHDEFAGVGSGSFGYLDGTIYANTFSVETYIQRLAEGNLPVTASRSFSRFQKIGYDMLRRLFGGSMCLREISAKHGRLAWIELSAAIVCLALTGAASLRDGRLVLTPKGRYYLVILMREFFTGVNNLRQTCVDLQASTTTLPVRSGSSL